VSGELTFNSKPEIPSHDAALAGYSVNLYKKSATEHSCGSPILQPRPKTRRFLVEQAWIRLSPRYSMKILQGRNPSAC